MQCNRSTSFSRQSGKTQRESQQSHQLCQSRKSRQARQVLQSGESDQKSLPIKFEYTNTSSSESEEDQFGPDKISRKQMAKLSECFVSKTRITRQSKQSTILEDYENLS
jgi:hypothetical protein